MCVCVQGKHAYVDLQIQWHEYIRAIAAFVEAQALQDAQMVDTKLDHSVPTANAWLSIVTTVVKWSQQRLINLLLHPLPTAFTIINMQRHQA